MADKNVIIPDSPSPQQAQIKDRYEEWRIAYKEAQPKFVIENVRFQHDPEWNNRFFSMHYILSGRSIFWNTVAVLFFAAEFGFFLNFAFGWRFW